MPKISVIVPVYNVERYLRCCIDSILAQTYTDFELLLIDDGSRDSSGDICDKYVHQDTRVHVYHKSNGGVSTARNLGLDHALGEWIAFVDADDWVDTKYLEKLYAATLNSSVDMVMSDCSFVYPNHQEPYQMYTWNKQGIEGLRRYISTTWTCLWGNIHRKSLYNDLEMKCPEGISYCEDFHLIVRLCYKARQILNVHESIYFYRQQNCSVMHNLNKKTEHDEQWVYADIIRYFKEQGVYEDLKQELSWRQLKASQELVLDTSTFDKFKDYAADSKWYINSCPYINLKLKVLMWCLLHHLQPIVFVVIKLRKLLGR